MQVCHLAVVVSCLASCTRDPTQLVVWIDSDLPTAGETAAIDALHIRVEGPGSDPFERSVDLGSDGAAMPASFGIRPRGGDPRRIVRVEVRGERQGSPQVRARASTSFIEDRRLRLDLFLYASCVSEVDPCPDPDTNCVAGECVPAYRDPADLPAWFEPPDAAAPRDGAVDADAALDGGSEPWPGDLVRQVVVGDSWISAAAARSDGTVFLAGRIEGDVAFEDGAESNALEAGVVLAYGADRRLAWRTVLAASEAVALTAAAATDEGDVVVAGTYSGQPTFGPDTLLASAGRGYLIARLDGGDGDIVWARGWPSSNRTAGPLGLATRPGEAAVVGSYLDLDLDGRALLETTSGAAGVLVVADTESGDVLRWGTQAPSLYAAATFVAADGPNWRVAGFFGGGGVVGDPGLDMTGGVTLESQSIQPAFLSYWDAASCTARRAYAIEGTYTYAMWPASDLFAGTDVEGAGGSDGHVATLERTMAVDRDLLAGSPGSDEVRAAAVNGDHALVAGSFSGDAELLGASLHPVGSADAFVSRIDRTTGEGAVWAFGSPAYEDATAIVAGPAPGSFVVVVTIWAATAPGTVTTDLPVDVSSITGPGTVVIWALP